MQQKLVTWACAIFAILIVSNSKATTSSAANFAGTSIDDICKTTVYPDACQSALASAAGNLAASNKNHFDVSMQFAMKKLELARDMAYNFSNAGQKPNSGRPSGMNDCYELLDISLYQLNDVLNKGTNKEDISTWLSAALTNQVTCSESLQTVSSSDGRNTMDFQVQSLAKYVSTALALHVRTKGTGTDTNLSRTGNRRLLSDKLPAWLSADDRRLLLASPSDINADAVVAQDGTGTHKSINEAIASVLTSRSATTDGSGGGGSSRSVIYVKSGTYNENLRITHKQNNVMLMGDGKGKSIIVSNRNADDGWSTYESATVAAMGSGFIAKGLTIINNAGPSKHQAVALRVGSDKSVVYQCSIQGYQDTLYVYSNRQFYTETDIYGTVDFIFGNAAAVIQNCYIQPRKPNSNQHNTVTAQGRSDPNQNTGISIHRCRIVGASDLGSTPVYLGRPWQKYSRTVVMKTYLDGSIQPGGWDKWSGNFALDTLYYGEYGNTGSGSSISGRVQWGGVHSLMSTDEASKFTVGNFIVGDAWLPSSGVSYTSGL